ncbi:MAG: T9SS type A sorting domain-containing protein [Bacteroidota bacterium]
MKSQLFFLLISIGPFLSAQSFREFPPTPPFAGVETASIAFADVDGDNDQDVLIAGDNGFVPISRLYTNDGLGNFSEVKDTPFEGVETGAIAFADVDGDNDQDVLITGSFFAKLYTNDGSGVFTEVMNTPFNGVQNSAIAFADVDGDNDLDVMISGRPNGSGPDPLVTFLYTNDGIGNFSQMIGTPFVGVERGSIGFADVDGDNDPDVFLTGDAGAGPVSRLYTNDGMGNFTEVPGSSNPFVGVEESSIAFADLDGDNDQDLLLTGIGLGGGPIALLYTNDGSGNFSINPTSPIEGVYLSAIAFSDVDGDNDQDVLITGNPQSGSFRLSKLYSNDGSGNFSEVMGTPFIGVDRCSIGFADVDGDNDQDALIVGTTGFFRIATLYTNDGMGAFTEVRGPFDGVKSGSIAFADIDGDNDQDVLVSGRTGLSSITKLYTNDGVGNFSEVMNTPFDSVSISSIAFADVDGDNDQDVLITGSAIGIGPISKLYTNDGTGNFIELINTPFVGVLAGSIAIADVDGDNDQDVLLTGGDGSASVSKLYTNDGAGNFSEVMGTPFDGVSSSSIAFADVDGDNDEDVLITGFNDVSPISKLYTNDGAGTFTEVMGTPFVSVARGSIAFADVNGDNNPDVLITGLNPAFVPLTRLYTNDGMGNFTEAMGTPFENLGNSSIAFSDVDGDNHPDVLITGINAGILRSILYINNGMGNFSEVMDTPFEGVENGSIAFADVDGDHDSDILITGENRSSAPISKLYLNDGIAASIEGSGISASFEFVIYPSPTQENQIHLRYTSDPQANDWIQIRIFDLGGRLLQHNQKRLPVGEKTFSLDISSLNKGYYLVQLDNGKRRGIQKLVVQ